MSRYPLKRFWGKMLWHLWIGQARRPGSVLINLDIEVFNVGGFLTHADYGMGTDASFSALVEHRLIPARARSEGARRAGQLSICSPAHQDCGHVGHAGTGVVSLRGKPLSLPPLPLLLFHHFLLRAGLLGVACLLALGGLCTWWWLMGSRGLPLTMRS